MNTFKKNIQTLQGDINTDIQAVLFVIEFKQIPSTMKAFIIYQEMMVTL